MTALACVPTIMTSLIHLPLDADISSVPAAYTGGSPLPSELAAQFEHKLGIPVRNILGMTECTGLVLIEPADAPRVPGGGAVRRGRRARCAAYQPLRCNHASTSVKRTAAARPGAWASSAQCLPKSSTLLAMMVSMKKRIEASMKQTTPARKPTRA